MSLTLPIKFNQGWTNEMYDKYIYEYTQNPNEVLKLHMDGTQGSTTFTDNSPVANTITRHGGAIIDTNNKKFGTGAGLFNGSSDYLQLPYNSHFDFSTGDWTVDSWFNMSSIGGAIISKDKYGYTSDFGICIINSTQIISYSHATSENFTVTVPEMSVNVWYHVALVRHNGTNTFYLNGVAYGTSTMTYTNDSQDYLTIGCYSYNNPNSFFNGYIDELRMTREALWTSNFTPPKHPAEPMPLVAAWSFDKDLLTDDSGNNHTLTNVNNVAKVTGKSNYAASFNGSNYLINSSFAEQIYSLSVWFHTDIVFDKDTTLQALIGFGDVAGITLGNCTAYLDNEVISFVSVNAANRTGVCDISIPVGWHHLAIAWDSDNAKYKIYLDSVEQLTSPSTNNGEHIDLITSTEVRIADHSDYNGSYRYESLIDEILILKDQSLTQEDVTSLYNDGKGRYYRTKWNIISYSFQGFHYGYTSGGGDGSTHSNIIDKFSFSTDGNAVDVGDLTVRRIVGAGQSSSNHGYTSGGKDDSNYLNVIDKFSFSSDNNASDVGDLTVRRTVGAGQSSSNHGYTSGGEISNSYSNVIDKFSFRSDGNASDVGDLTAIRSAVAGQSSSSYGYSSGGYNGNIELNIIDKFSFSSDNNASDVGDLTLERHEVAGQSSTNYGYTSGGYHAGDVNTIDKFSFSSDGNATDVGDLIVSRGSSAGQSSNKYGYSSGGYVYQGSFYNTIDKFSFSNDGNASDVGDLTIAREGMAGQQY